MKKLISLILALLLVAGMLAACAPSNTDGTEAAVQTSEPEESTHVPEGEPEPPSKTPGSGEPGEPEQETTEGVNPTEPEQENTEGTDTTEPTQAETTKPTQPPHTHSYTSTKVAATCTKGGYTLHKCSCGSSYTTDETAALGHSWGNWTVVTQPTTQQEGRQTRTCSRCGATESQSIPKVEAPALEWSDLDLNKAAAVGNQYAASRYGCIPDTSLNVNSPYVGYDFPISYGKGEVMSYVPSSANSYQAAVELLVKGSVDFFAETRQLYGYDNIAGWHINCYCEIKNNMLWIYVFY